MKTKQFLQKGIDYGLLACFFAFPIFMNIALFPPEDPVHPLIAVNVSVAEIMIGIILLLWVLKIMIYNEWKRIKLPPIPIVVFIGTGLLSLINAFSVTQWLKEIIQMIEYFLIFYLLLIYNLQSIKLVSLKNILFISASIILIVAFIQHSFLHADPYFVKGLFENRNILGTFLCMVIPLAYVELLSTNNLFQKIWMSMILLLTLIVVVSGSAMLSIIVSLVIVSWLYDKKVFVRFLLAIFILTVVYPIVMPIKNVQAFKEFASIYEQGSISENYYRRLTLLGNVAKNTLVKRNAGDNYLLVTSDKFMSVKMPGIEKGERHSDMEGEKHIKNRFLEMQASINMISENTLLGVGLGNFQNYIGTYYNKLPKVNTAEPNQHNGYLIIASTSGLLGLSALLWLFLSSLKSAKKRFYSSGKEKYLFLGLMGSLLACMIENFFSYLFITSLLIPFVFIIYLSHKEVV